MTVHLQPPFVEPARQLKFLGPDCDRLTQHLLNIVLNSQFHTGLLS